MPSLLHSVAASYREGGVSGTLRAIRRRLFGVRLSRASVDELGIAAAALDLTAERGVMVDVGAHHGSSCGPFCRAGWRVLAFEPDAGNRALLENYLSDFDDVTIDARALSNREQEGVAFFRSAQSTGISGLAAFHETHEQVGTVSTTTLRRALSDHGIGRIDVLKIDTEGHDKLVLEGFPWDGELPRLIICEFEDKKTVPLGYRYTDLIEMLQDKGFQVIVSEWQPIVEYGGRHQWASYHAAPCRLDDDRAWGNLVALRDPADLDAVMDGFADTAGRLGMSVKAGGAT